jgi:hypothetical protein
VLYTTTVLSFLMICSYFLINIFYALNFTNSKTSSNAFYVHVNVHRGNFLIIKPSRCTNFPIYFGMKLYMFRAVPLPIIRILFTVHSAMVYVIQVWRQLSSITILVLLESYIGVDCTYFLLKNDSKEPATRYYVWSQVTKRTLHHTARLLWTVRRAINV